MCTNGLLLIDARLEVFALQHLLQGHPAVEANDVFKRHGAKPVAVTHRLRARWIKNFECLLAIGYRICDHFLMRQLRPRNRTTARVADHSGEVADDQNGLVTEVLKLPQFSKNNRVAEVNVRGGGIDSEFYS